MSIGIKSLDNKTLVPEKRAAAIWLEAKFDIDGGSDEMMMEK
jgi:hypothetical protein